MSEDAVVLIDRTRAYDDGTVVSVRVLDVPSSDTYPEGVKYAFHYGVAGASHPVIRFDNHHGTHDLHLGETTFEIGFPGLEPLGRAFRAALPEEKRADW